MKALFRDGLAPLAWGGDEAEDADLRALPRSIKHE